MPATDGWRWCAHSPPERIPGDPTKIPWALAAAIALACAGFLAWRGSVGGAGMLQAFLLGAAASVACVILLVALGEPKRRLVGSALLAGYGLALVGFLAALGNVR